MYYINYYEYYPIYESAEGGYYYSGRKCAVLNSVNEWKKAKKIFNRLAKNFTEENENVVECRISFFWKDDNKGQYIETLSKYIGEGCGIAITKKSPLNDIGYTPYC